MPRPNADGDCVHGEENAEEHKDTRRGEMLKLRLRLVGPDIDLQGKRCEGVHRPLRDECDVRDRTDEDQGRGFTDRS